MADTEVSTPLFDESTLPHFEEPSTHPSLPCEAQLADLLAAVSNMAGRIEAVVSAVNSIGEITESTQHQIAAVVDFIAEFQKRFSGMSPTDMIKTMLKGGV